MTETPEIRLYIASAADFGDSELCERFVSSLESLGGRWIPDRFGSAEPLRARFDAEGRPGICAAWTTSPRPGAQGGDLIFKTSKQLNARGWVYWRRGLRHDINFVQLSLPESKTTNEVALELVDLGTKLMAGMRGIYGRVFHSIDYDRQHKYRTGTGFQYVGQRLSEGLPGIYWANLFGREIVDFLGEEKFEACPAARKYRTNTGTWVLFSSQHPDEFRSTETQSLRLAMRAALGQQHFFDIEKPDVRPTPLTFDRSGMADSMS